MKKALIANDMILKTLIGILLMTLTISHVGATEAVECGTVLEMELTPNNSQKKDTYTIEFSAGDTVTITVEPIGQGLAPQVIIYDPSNRQTSYANTTNRGRSVSIKNLVLGSSGRYTITVEGLLSTIGAYTLSVGCTLRDGTIINPGDVEPLRPLDDSSGVIPTLAAPTFSGTGFPGLAPVDFATATIKPVTFDAPIIGAVDSSANTILGYTVDAAANDTLALGFTRLSGNLNLGLVVLSADNQVVFQASLVTSSELTTKFTVPTAGTYTIGVFRIDLLPPAAPEATAFQLTATLNP